MDFASEVAGSCDPCNFQLELKGQLRSFDQKWLPINIEYKQEKYSSFWLCGRFQVYTEVVYPNTILSSADQQCCGNA